MTQSDRENPLISPNIRRIPCTDCEDAFSACCADRFPVRRRTVDGLQCSLSWYCGAWYFGRDRLSQKHIETISFGLIIAAAFIVLAILVIILQDIIINGLPALSWEFLTQPPKDLGRAGGIFPAIVGTLYLVLGAIAIALPLGVGAAIYLVEYTREGRITRLIRTGVDLLNGTPSIVFGLFGFAFIVLYLNVGVSLLAGQITLALMVLPTVIRTTEESLKNIPQSLREGSLALGATRWQTISRVVLPPAVPGIVTGAILSIGRAAGETAPIMFTAVVFSSRFLPDFGIPAGHGTALPPLHPGNQCARCIDQQIRDCTRPFAPCHRILLGCDHRTNSFPEKITGINNV